MGSSCLNRRKSFWMASNLINNLDEIWRACSCNGNRRPRRDSNPCYRLRAKRLRDAIESNNVPPYRDWMRFIKPRGAEQIVYGDKVICVRNHKRQPYIYATKEKGEREFLANGEIGMVVGQMQWPRGKPSFTQIEFAGRDDRNYSFTRSAFSEDGQPYLELAYAITVHKAQGSEFGVVMLILPSFL
jgi:ATP-dependent exoDNAse (exonuclease V) alpha subunit